MMKAENVMSEHALSVVLLFGMNWRSRPRSFAQSSRILIKLGFLVTH